MHGLHLPEWTLSFVVVRPRPLGFPVTAALAWVFDLKASGIERTAPGGRRRPVSRRRLSRPRRRRLLLLGLGLRGRRTGPRLLLRLAGGRAPPGGAPPAASSARPRVAPSIAVLPFANLSSDKEQEYFSDGIAEEILNALAQVDGLRVIGRTSSFSMKGKNEDLRTIGQRLGAANLLEGSVRKAGSRVRITAQLIEAAGGSHLWSQEFDRDLTDVFAVQEEIAHAVVAALKLKLLPGQAESQRTVDPRAHDPYLLGLAYLARGSGNAYGQAVQVLRKAVELDPGYAQAWAALATALFWSADQSEAGDFRSGVAAGAGRGREGDRAGARPGRRLPGARDAPDDGAPGPRGRPRRPRACPLAQPAESGGPVALRVAARRDGQAARGDRRVPGGRHPRPALRRHAGGAEHGLPRHRTARAGRRCGPRALELSPRATGGPLATSASPCCSRVASRGPSRLPPVDQRALRGHGRRDGRARAGASRRVPARARLHPFGPASTGPGYQVAQIYAWRGSRTAPSTWLDHAAVEHDAGLTYLKYDPLLRNLRGDPRFAALLPG